MANFGEFLRPVFSASRVRHTSDLHSKFALRPHHVRKYGIDIQSATAENINQSINQFIKIHTSNVHASVQIA